MSPGNGQGPASGHREGNQNRANPPAPWHSKIRSGLAGGIGTVLGRPLRVVLGVGKDPQPAHLEMFHVGQYQTVTVMNTTVAKTANHRPHIDHAKRQANRQLPTEQLLALLRNEAPRFYELAQVVGKWVWIQFSEKQPPQVTAGLAQLGFHWNNNRQVWQHPCGTVTGDASPDDPRQKYGTFFPSDEFGPHAPA